MWIQQLPLCRLIPGHHLLSISSFQTQTQVLRWAAWMVHAPHWPNLGSTDQLVPESRRHNDIRSIWGDINRPSEDKFILNSCWEISFHHQIFTSSAEGRSLGSKASSRSSKRRAKGSTLGNFCEKGTGGFFLMLLKYLLALSFRICR